MSKTKSPKLPPYCWIRESKPDGSSHRIGCITMKRVNAIAVRVAFSLCAPCDAKRFDLRRAKKLAIMKLNPNDTIYKNKVIKIADIENAVDWASALGISQTVWRHCDQEGRVYAWDRNNSALLGLLSEVVQ